MAIKILYEDKWLCLCIKEAGVLSEEGGMPELLKEHSGKDHFLCSPIGQGRWRPHGLCQRQPHRRKALNACIQP